MNEADTRAEYIDTALRDAGWGVVDGSRITREYPITKGKLQSGGGRGKAYQADYILIYRNQKLAVVEAKALGKVHTEGVSQAKFYAEKLRLALAYSTNGKKIRQIQMFNGKEQDISSFPSPEELWKLAKATTNEWQVKFDAMPFNDRDVFEPRYYQDLAVSAVLKAISKGQRRILLTMATGTGKTAIAFQIAWKLFSGRWNMQGDGRQPRILFLADRNTLADQAFNQFSGFPEGGMVRLRPAEIRRQGIPLAGAVYFAIFQTFMSGHDERGNPKPYYGQYPPDFFDFVIVDECHRGGAKDESEWRGILEYFSSAVQLGMTATPKRRDNVDTYRYFGKPVFSYSLKDGIDDGFLTPFRVRVYIGSADFYKYHEDDEVEVGEIEKGKTYCEEEINRIIEIPAREKSRIAEFMHAINQRDKTIVFCANQRHALVVRDWINEIKESKNPRYCVRVTSDDGDFGDRDLREFQENERTIPTILTTSRKLSTGVDARNVRNIVLMRSIKSMIEFKQIIGRGTRLFDGKNYFTVYDFVQAHEHFQDREWDGEPQLTKRYRVKKREGGEDYEVTSMDDGVDDAAENGVDESSHTDDGVDDSGNNDENSCREKIVIRMANNREREITYTESTIFYDKKGTVISARDFVQKLYGDFLVVCGSEQKLRQIWGASDTRQQLLDTLSQQGYDREQLANVGKLLGAVNCDLFDVLANLVFELPVLSRGARVGDKKSQILAGYSDKQQAFLEFVLSQYVAQGEEELNDDKLSQLLELKHHTLVNATAEIGKMPDIRRAFVNLQKRLYS